jgi:hypothetical protein
VGVSQSVAKYAVVVSAHTDLVVGPIDENDTDLLVFRKSGKLRKDNILMLSHKFSISHTYLNYIIKNYSKLPEIILFCNDACEINPVTCYDVLDNPTELGFGYIDLGEVVGLPTHIRVKKSYTRWQNEIVDSRKSPLKNSSSSFLVSRELVHRHPIHFYKNLILKCEKYEASQVEEYFEKLWARIFT